MTAAWFAWAPVSGWRLSFTVSIDDLILTTFFCGPGSTALTEGARSRQCLKNSNAKEDA